MLQQILSEAISLHQHGRLLEAVRLYQRILRIDARHADSLCLLGTIAYQTASTKNAIDLIRKAIGISEQASYYSNLDLALQALGKLEDAAGV